jgi:Kef-type K+ transport system membrane component KefB
MEILFSLSIIFIFGLLIGHALKMIKLPEVMGYLIAGIVIGPYVLNLVTFDSLNSMELFSTIALSFVSFLIGAEFKWNYVKRLGKKPFIIGLTCSLFTMFVVTGCLYLSGSALSFALIMGAIAAATAPAAIMMIVKEYKARGEVTDTMLSVIAIEDVSSVIIFGFTIVMAQYLESGNATLSGLLEPFSEIGISLVMGTVLGLFLGITAKLFKTKNNIICLILVTVFTAILISDYAEISSLLMCMVTGMVFVNAYNRIFTDKVLDVMDGISSPLMIIFFVISGASLDFKLLPEIGVIGIIFILARAFGKMFGAYLGATIGGSSKNVRKYLGPTLLSETGIAIGLALFAKELFPNEGETLIAITIASSFIFDMIGPFLVKISLKKAGEIK